MQMHELDRRELLPYALFKLESDRYEHVWLPVNRDYARPAEAGQSWDLQAHIANAMVFARDPCTFEGVWAGDTTTGRALYLFDRGDDPVADYRERLERLLAHYHFFHGDPPPLHFAPERKSKP